MQSMKHLETQNYLTDKQNGGREGRASIDIVALKLFTAKVHHYQQSNPGITDCNTKACYDQITRELLTLLYTKAGCPPKVVDLLYSALTSLEYSMVTALEISESKSISTINNLLFGIGKGACDGPPG
eukprot:15259662-Ditylum_brightwellii.AAC.1